MKETMKNNANPLFFSLHLLVGLNASAGRVFRFDDFSASGSAWMDGRNRRVKTAGDINGCLPGAEDTVRFNHGGATGFPTSAAGTVYQLQIGIGNLAGKLILNPGAKLVVSRSDNRIGWLGAAGEAARIVNGGDSTVPAASGGRAP